MSNQAQKKENPMETGKMANGWAGENTERQEQINQI